MSKSNIGIVCYNAVPYTDNWGASQRIHYMANSLSGDYNVTVFASRNLSAPASFGVDQAYSTVFLNNPLRHKLFSPPAKGVGKEGCRKSGNLRHHLYKLALRISSVANRLFYNEPVCSEGIEASWWIRSHTGEILNRARKENIRCMIFTIPPWNMVSTSMLKALRRLGVKIVVDYRDPWNCWNDRGGIPKRKEGKILRLADIVTVTNEFHAQRLSRDFNLPAHRTNVVMNGYDAELWDKISPQPKNPEMLTISFIGTISFNGKGSFRDPRLFMSALGSVPFKNRILFRVVGCHDSEAIDRYRDKIPNFEMIPKVSQRESFEWMLRSDVLVNFHTTQDQSSAYLIAGKAFDYYRSGARLLSINGERSYERRFIESLGIGYYSPNDVEAIRNVLSRIYSDWERGVCNAPRKADMEYSRQRQCARMNRTVAGLLADAP